MKIKSKGYAAAAPNRLVVFDAATDERVLAPLNCSTDAGAGARVEAELFQIAYWVRGAR